MLKVAMRLAMVSVCAAVFSSAAFGALFDNAWIKGTTNKNPIGYAPGEEIVMTLDLIGFEGDFSKGGYLLRWSSSDDYGNFKSGIDPIEKFPIEFRTKLDKPGFVRYSVTVLDKDGKPVVKHFTGDDSTPEGRAARNKFERERKTAFFEGGAGVEIDKLTGTGEPEDFDAFWARQFARLDKVPMREERVEVASCDPRVRMYAVRVDCAGLRPVTGYLSVPKAVDGGAVFPCKLETHGYDDGLSMHNPPNSVRTDAIVLNINAHGMKLPAFGGTETDLKALRWEVGSHDRTYGFDPRQNKDPETAYFNGMVLRVKRALQYLKSVKGWNGKDLVAEGGSQGGLQTVWAAACGEGVTLAIPVVPWCCDLPRNNDRLAKKASTCGWYIPWVKGMGYYDTVNWAKRIPTTCRTDISRAGLGDYICPPMGVAKLYNAIPGDNKSIRWVQGSDHGYEPPEYEGRDVRLGRK